MVPDPDFLDLDFVPIDILSTGKKSDPDPNIGTWIRNNVK